MPIDVVEESSFALRCDSRCRQISSCTALSQQQRLLPTSTLGDANSSTEASGGNTGFRRQDAATAATFNGVPVTLQTGPLPQGSFACQTPPLDDDDATPSWYIRSCEYRNLCFDTATGDFVLAGTKEAPPPPVSIGGINPRWRIDRHKPERNESKLMWRPTLVSKEQRISSSFYYQLPSHVLLLPFHSMAAHNVGHLLWDDTLALWSLVRNWYGGDDTQQQQLLPLRVVLPEQSPLYASCDIRRNKRLQCTKNLQRWMVPILGGGGASPITITSTKRAQLVVPPNPSATLPTEQHSQQELSTPTLVCAARSVAGLGFWTDHGLSDHGWDAVSLPSHNIGRGALLYDWSVESANAVLLSSTQHANEATELSKEEPEPQQQFRIVLSIRSTRDKSRAWDDWERYRDMLRDTFSSSEYANTNNNIVIEAIEMSTLSITEQISLAQRTDVWITMCGGGAVTATWLPRHATLIVLYSPTAGLDFTTLQSVDRPTRLDADLWNHASYLRVHWIPWVKPQEGNGLKTREDTTDDSAALTPDALFVMGALVEHEYDVWRSR